MVIGVLDLQAFRVGRDEEDGWESSGHVEAVRFDAGGKLHRVVATQPVLFCKAHSTVDESVVHFNDLIVGVNILRERGACLCCRVRGG